MSTAFDDNEEPVVARERSDKPGPIRLISAVLWPGFVIAFIATAVVFSFIDPYHVLDGTRYAGASLFGVYTLCFLFLWLVISLSAAATLWFLKPGLEVATPLPRTQQGRSHPSDSPPTEPQA